MPSEVAKVRLQRYESLEKDIFSLADLDMQRSEFGCTSGGYGPGPLRSTQVHSDQIDSLERCPGRSHLASFPLLTGHSKDGATWKTTGPAFDGKGLDPPQLGAKEFHSIRLVILSN
jgi:hypothetical protein